MRYVGTYIPFGMINNSCIVRLSSLAVSVLICEPLTNEQYLKLNKTALLRVLKTATKKPKLVRTLSGKFHPDKEDAAATKVAEDELAALLEDSSATPGGSTEVVEEDHIDITDGMLDEEEADFLKTDPALEALLEPLPMAADGSVDVAGLLQRIQSQEAPRNLAEASSTDELSVSSDSLNPYRNDFEVVLTVQWPTAYSINSICQTSFRGWHWYYSLLP